MSPPAQLQEQGRNAESGTPDLNPGRLAAPAPGSRSALGAPGAPEGPPVAASSNAGQVMKRERLLTRQQWTCRKRRKRRRAKQRSDRRAMARLADTLPDQADDLAAELESIRLATVAFLAVGGGAEHPFDPMANRWTLTEPWYVAAAVRLRAAVKKTHRVQGYAATDRETVAVLRFARNYALKPGLVGRLVP